MQWKKLQKVFRKKKMKSISVVKYLVNDSIIRILTQLQMEKVVMDENAIRFSLAYSSLVFEKGTIEKRGRMGQTLKVQGLIHYNIPITTHNSEVNTFLPLLYQLHPNPINAHINLER